MTTNNVVLFPGVTSVQPPNSDDIDGYVVVTEDNQLHIVNEKQYIDQLLTMFGVNIIMEIKESGLDVDFNYLENEKLVLGLLVETIRALIDKAMHGTKAAHPLIAFANDHLRYENGKIQLNLPEAK